ncbi:putative transposase [Escherichia coli p0305293.7]|nr:putative transposase [Escherichia coli p0305293.2]ENG74328.1 putative transposase [Escherichia coli p0305293.4]ENH50295.1 putative transposase [Escherichia coli p0305293.7]EPH49244.1 Mobile element protein [Escherichia coli E2265]
MNTRNVHTGDTPVKVLTPGRKKQKQAASGRMSGIHVQRIPLFQQVYER